MAKRESRKLLGGAIILGGVGLVAYYFLTRQAAAQPPTPTPGKTPQPPPPTPPPNEQPKVPPSTPPIGPGVQPPPPTPSTSAALRLEVTENGSFDIGAAFYSVKDGSGKWSTWFRFPNDTGRDCIQQLVAGWGAIRIRKTGFGGGFLSPGWGGWDTGDLPIYLYPGSRTVFKLNSIDVTPQAPTTTQEAASPTC